MLRLDSAWFSLIGLFGCTPTTGSVAEPDAGEPTMVEGTEPSGRSAASTLAGESALDSTRPESREWCNTIIDTRPRELLRTQSFLLAWNEIRTITTPMPGPVITLNEHDARLAICHAAECKVAEIALVEINTHGKISLGAVVPVADGMLVVPGLGPAPGAVQCPGGAQLRSERVGETVHVWTEATPRPPIHHHHGYAGYYGYGGCYGDQNRHDVFVDLESNSVVVTLEHRQAVQVAVAARSDERGFQLTLTGCSEVLELAWTDLSSRSGSRP